MEKLSDFLLNMDLSVTPDGLPVLSTEEEQDVLDQLGVREKPDEAQGALELIMAKMKNVREFSLATGDAAKEAENDEEFADYGTVIIKTKSGKSTEGTLRVKKGDERFGSIIFRGGDIEAADLPADAFSTMRVIETAGGDDSKPLWASGGSQSDSSSHGDVRSRIQPRSPNRYLVGTHMCLGVLFRKLLFAMDLPMPGPHFLSFPFHVFHRTSFAPTSISFISQL